LVEVKINGTPESRAAVGYALPDRGWSIEIECCEPFTYNVMARTSTSQKKEPPFLVATVEYLTLLGSGTSCEGWRPMPSCDGTAVDPGRERESEKKRDEGAEPAGVMPKRLEENGAPSRPFPVVGIISSAIRELAGRARPKMPLNPCSRGSESTLVAAAARKKYASRKVGFGMVEGAYPELDC
jgi:hypothetical protein